MSSTDLQDHTFVKVLFDFQYKTTEGRDISIRKNEQLVLLQKTNVDWWQVFRTTEQRSFYVPATYVRELSVQSSSCKNTEEERENASMDPSEGPKYKSMPKETTSAIKNVKKWLAGAMECTQDSSKSHEVYDDYKKYNAIDYQTRAELKIGLAAIKSKSLEREMKNLQLNSSCNRELTDERRKSKDLTKKNDTSDNLKTSNTQPTKSFDHSTKIDSPFQDGFRKELESSLDRRNQRKISGSTIDYEKIKSDNHDYDLKKKLLKTRVRTLSSRSDDSQLDSDTEDKLDSRINLSLNNELKDKLSPANSKRNSRSLDFEIKKIGQRTERSLSPKPIYGRQLTIAGCNISNNDVDIDDADDSNDNNTDKHKIIGHKILNDKRSTWAVEELMSELTQMCKERSTASPPTIVNKKPNFQLKSTEIKSTFDPHDELTRELHEMNLQRSSGGGGTQKIENSSTSNISKVSLNQSEKPQDKLRIETMVLHEVDEQPETSTDKFTFSLKNSCELSGSQMKPLRSPKSPKILDEYNEANILNDSPTSPDDESLDDTQSLSDDKKTKCPISIKQELTIEKCHESPSYSNIKLKNSERVKLRPKIKIKNDDTQGELKLTPSLEKLASEIKFIPSKKINEVIEVDKNKNIQKIGIKNMDFTLIDDKKIDKYDDSKTFDDSGIVDESLGTTDDEKIENNWLKFKNKLGYTGSFKTKREGKYFYKNKNINNYGDEDDDDDIDDEWKNGLKRTSTMHYTTVPESHRRHKRNDVFKLNKLQKFKRKSRSLSDLRSLEEIADENIEDNLIELNKKKILRRPVPLPRTKLPGSDAKKSPDLRKDGYNTDEEIWVTRDDIYPSKSSTAVGFKSLLSPSDSGSDNCLQSKELMESADELDLDDYKIDKLKFKKYNNKQQLKESLSDEIILSSNASSEALQSQSESEFTAGLDPSSSSPQQSPVDAHGGPDGFEYNIELPPGWTSKYDSQSEQMCFVNKQGDRWFSSHDAEGKIYFFKENSNESFWVLPTISQDHLPPAKSSAKSNRLSSSPKFIPPPSLNEISVTKKFTNPSTISQPIPASSNLIPRYENVATKKILSSPNDWPQLSFDGNMKILKEGQINRTKITENGKKLRKNWSTSYAVLTELFLLFFKDSKTFSTMMKSGQCPAAKPDISVDLNGARIELSDRASSRKNVYTISTVLGLQVLIQSDNTSYSAEWYQDINGVIKKLPSGYESQQMKSTGDGVRQTSSSKSDKQSETVTDDGKKGGKLSRSKSMKMKRTDDSLEDLPNGSVAEKVKIKEKLKRFFLRRPSVESLVKVGIYKNEPAFGSSLQDVCPNTSPCVPAFVKKCIEVLESNEDNMKTDGLYRASGNLSQIQKIRLQIDQDKLNVLALEEDVHVLTGALKLFFRELKEPLIPSYLFKDALNANNVTKQTTKIQRFRDIIKLLPQPNHDTLQFLLKHLLKVTSYQEYNRMHIPNLAIVFGPTLMWPAEESRDMALDLMQQNSFIDFLLTEYNKIFK